MTSQCCMSNFAILSDATLKGHRHIRGGLYQKQVSRTESNYTLQFLWDVITCSCPWLVNLPGTERLLVHKCIQWTCHQIRKIVGCACAGNAGNVLPGTPIKETAHGVLRVPCMSIAAQYPGWASETVKKLLEDGHERDKRDLLLNRPIPINEIMNCFNKTEGLRIRLNNGRLQLLG